MKKIIKKFLFVVSIPFIAMAQTVPYPAAPGGSVNIQSTGQLGTTIGLIVRFFGSFIFAISVLVFLYAGFLYLMADENEDNTTKARQFLTWGVVGLVVALVAGSIPYLVASILGGTPLQ